MKLKRINCDRTVAIVLMLIAKSVGMRVEMDFCTKLADGLINSAYFHKEIERMRNAVSERDSEAYLLYASSRFDDIEEYITLTQRVKARESVEYKRVVRALESSNAYGSRLVKHFSTRRIYDIA